MSRALRIVATLDEKAVVAGTKRASDAINGLASTAERAGRQIERGIKPASDALGPKMEDSTKRVEAALRQLGVKSDDVFERQRQSAIRAYDAIAKSGTASAREIAAAYEATSRRIAKLNEQQAAQAAALPAAAGGGDGGGSGFAGGILAAGGASRLAAAGAGLLAVGGALASGGAAAFAFSRGLISTKDAIDGAGDAAANFGIKAQDLVGFRFAAGKSGLGPEQADIALQKLNVALGELEQRAEKSRDALEDIGIAARTTNGAAIPLDRVFANVQRNAAAAFRGDQGALAVFRQANVDIQAIAKNYGTGAAGIQEAALQVLRFAGTAGGPLSESQKALQEFAKIRAPDGTVLDAFQVLNSLSDNLKDLDPKRVQAILGSIFGERIGPRLAGFLGQGSAGIAADAAGAPTFSDQALANADRLDKALFNLSGSFENIRNRIFESSMPIMEEKINGLIAALNAAAPSVQAFANVFGPALLRVLLGSTAYDTFKAVTGKGFATGGMISGPGTGTSDSILARVSSGEYVMRAAAVQHYGPAMMERLNKLALPRYADGGMVESIGPSDSGGTPIYLSLPNGRTAGPMSAGDDVVKSLIRWGTRQNLRAPVAAPAWAK